MSRRFVEERRLGQEAARVAGRQLASLGCHRRSCGTYEHIFMATDDTCRYSQIGEEVFLEILGLGHPGECSTSLKRMLIDDSMQAKCAAKGNGE